MDNEEELKQDGKEMCRTHWHNDHFARFKAVSLKYQDFANTRTAGRLKSGTAGRSIATLGYKSDWSDRWFWDFRQARYEGKDILWYSV